LGGCLVFAAAARTVRTVQRAAYVVAALGFGAVVSAALGILEVWFPDTQRALMPFREQNSFVGGFSRASGTFDYANTASMYREADWYRPVYRISPESATVEARSVVTFDLSVRNGGMVTWRADGRDRVALSYYWDDVANPRNRLFSDARVPLPGDVEPGHNVS